jgi:hypothetical protein
MSAMYTKGTHRLKIVSRPMSVFDCKSVMHSFFLFIMQKRKILTCTVDMLETSKKIEKIAC